SKTSPPVMSGRTAGKPTAADELGNALDQFETRTRTAILDAADGALLKANGGGHGLLAKALRFALFADARAELAQEAP
ncbi:MAG: hypothetical protein ABI432_00460, partial [Flavobacteriales bacterium]